MALVIGGIGEGHCAVVISSWFWCYKGNVVDPDNGLVDVAPALAAEVEGSGLGGFDRGAWSVRFDDFGNRLNLGKDGWCGSDADCAQGQGFTCVP